MPPNNINDDFGESTVKQEENESLLNHSFHDFNYQKNKDSIINLGHIFKEIIQERVMKLKSEGLSIKPSDLDNDGQIRFSKEERFHLKKINDQQVVEQLRNDTKSILDKVKGVQELINDLSNAKHLDNLKNKLKNIPNVS